MKKLLCITMAIFICSQANADLVSVSGPDSSASVAASIITAPTHALDDNVTNNAQQGFNEQQGVALAEDIAVDGGTIAGGTVVDSHMIFLNSSGSTLVSHGNVLWTFDGDILGVMSQQDGAMEFNTTEELGASGTIYQTAPLGARGLESPTIGGSGGSTAFDGYTITGTTLLLGMRVTEPGDWIRVITASVPEPGALLLLALGLLGLIGRQSRDLSNQSAGAAIT